MSVKNCVLRRWLLSDAADLAAGLNNRNVLNNLRDGLPFPYTEQDARDYITAMLSSDENSTFAYAITVDGRANRWWFAVYAHALCCCK